MKVIKIKDVCEFKYGKNLPQATRRVGKYPVFGSSGCVDQHDEFLVEGPGIIIGRKGTVGAIQWSKKDFFPIDTTYYITHNPKKIDLKYLYYRLLLSGLETMNSDSAVPGLNRTAAINHRISIHESLYTQLKIASILSAYDDLIENNLKRIKLLEEVAQITFNDWFGSIKERLDNWEDVNLGSFVDHEIGGGWGKDVESPEYCKPAFVIRGTDINDLPNGRVEGVPFRYHKKSNLASRKLQHGDIVFEVSGGSSNEGVAKTLLVTNDLLEQFEHDVMCASFCKLLRLKNKDHAYFIFHFLRFLREVKATEVFEIRSASNIVNYNWKAFLKFQEVRKPSEELLLRFKNLAEPIHKQIYNLGQQNQLLKEARDILLPRLMTGMIDVEKIGDEFPLAADPSGEYRKN